ncbi:hypothetical protein TNCV_921951 [Trichonephila clavipes]|nr:hypothetical protein TNCV_921951 [Trichonephila clavipes]
MSDTNDFNSLHTIDTVKGHVSFLPHCLRLLLCSFHHTQSLPYRQCQRSRDSLPSACRFVSPYCYLDLLRHLTFHKAPHLNRVNCNPIPCAFLRIRDVCSCLKPTLEAFEQVVRYRTVGCVRTRKLKYYHCSVEQLSFPSELSAPWDEQKPDFLLGSPLSKELALEPDGIGNVTEEYLCRQINLETDTDDVQELLDPHNRELTIDELIEMHEHFCKTLKNGGKQEVKKNNNRYADNSRPRREFNRLDSQGVVDNQRFEGRRRGGQSDHRFHNQGGRQGGSRNSAFGGSE